MVEFKETLDRLYTDPSSPGGYSSLERLYKEARKVHPNIKRKDIEEFLAANRTFTLFKHRRLKFNRFVFSHQLINIGFDLRSKFVPSGFMTHIHVDLGDFQKLKKENSGYAYLLVGVDLLSRRAFAVPLKTKETNEVIRGFDELFEQMPYLPQEIFSG